jgi:hypothetical protein
MKTNCSLAGKLLKELNSAAKIPARKAEVVSVFVAEGATLKFEFYVEPDVIFKSEIGFCLRKKMTVPGGDEEEDTIYHMELPWIGMERKPDVKNSKIPALGELKSATLLSLLLLIQTWVFSLLVKYATGVWVNGMWGPSLQTTEVDLCWDNSHCSMISKSVDYHVRVIAGDEDEMDDDLALSKEDLVTFYEKHDAEKVAEIDTFLNIYSKTILLK